MIECRYCGEVFYAEAGRFGARCRRCHEPLYERREASLPLPSDGASGQCATHPRNPSVGACQRCGTFLCAVCRTRWRERTLCLACVERALEEKEARPEDARSHRRQAMVALGAGITGWALLLVASLLLVLTRNNANASAWMSVAVLLGLVGLVVALFGSGAAVSALRGRGNRMVLATWGLILAGAQAGVVLGLLSLGVWPR
ncbi:MAG TPA: hypothetical protein VEL76_22345 [Gemmataceae bacterium]|nr:hypothetical protein [Gemmataceae bacterium]